MVTGLHAYSGCAIAARPAGSGPLRPRPLGRAAAPSRRAAPPAAASQEQLRSTAESVKHSTLLVPVQLAEANTGLSAEANANQDDSLCDFCRYKCRGDGSGARSCDEAALWLQEWAGQEHAKPPGFDRSHRVQLGQFADIAAASAGGRCNADWKADNQDAFLLASLHGGCLVGGASSGLRAASAAVCEASEAGAAPQGAVVGVFDGHGRLGGRVSHIIRDAVSEALRRELAGGAGAALAAPAAAGGVLERCFDRAAADLHAGGHDLSRSGSTAVVCVINQDSITAAWTGDSRAVLGVCTDTDDEDEQAALGSDAFAAAGSFSSTTGASRLPATASRPAIRVVPLTRDHKPHEPKEKQRITAMGGRVARMAKDANGNLTGPFRVFLPGMWAPGLALSRAFGDTLVSSFGVVHTPETKSVSLPRPSGRGGSSGQPATSNVVSAGAMAAPGTGLPAGSLEHTAGRRHVLVVASDGLWEWVSSEDAVRLAAAMPTAADAAFALVEAAKRQWAVRYKGANCDDITACVAFLPA